ncbi:acyltransferase family protein [Paraburkholderia tropica]|uniref:acyltransferase family protein n=1 Tax=Paraburkholderia tropica TaxID=92647 RepID=UPI002AB5EC0F|nr:acyltransferase [Paraburkholderia tropica]
MRKNNFNQIRLWLAISVLFTHAFALTGNHVPATWGLSSGAFSIFIFFTISGYLVTQSWDREPNILPFIRKRALRLLPGWAASFVATYAIVHFCNGFSGNATGIQNGSWWTLPWESLCYAAVVGLGFAGALNTTAFAAFFGAAWLVYFCNIGSQSVTMKHLTPLFMFFLMGAFIALNEKRLNIRTCAIYSTICLAVFFIVPIRDAIFWLLHETPFVFGPGASDFQIRQVALLICIPFVAIYLAKYAPAIPFLEADLSYGTYVFGWPIQQATVYVARHYGHPIESGIGLFCAATPLILCVATASWYFVEKPALKLKGRRPGTHANHPAERQTGKV